VEGTVNKIKARKMQLFGRAKPRPPAETHLAVLNVANINDHRW